MKRPILQRDLYQATARACAITHPIMHSPHMCKNKSERSMNWTNKNTEYITSIVLMFRIENGENADLLRQVLRNETTSSSSLIHNNGNSLCPLQPWGDVWPLHTKTTNTWSVWSAWLHYQSPWSPRHWIESVGVDGPVYLPCAACNLRRQCEPTKKPNGCHNRIFNVRIYMT